MALTYKLLLIFVGVFGLGMGIAFGAGVAYGRGDPKTVETGLSAQQIQSMLGISGAGASGGSGGTGASGTTGGGTGGTGGGQGQRGGGTGGANNAGGNTQQGATTASARGTVGTIQSVSGQTITVDTRQGSTKVNLGTTTTISKLSIGQLSDLRAGTSIVVVGTRKDDGSYDATEVAQVPADLQSLLTGTTGGGGTSGGSGGSGGASATPASGR